MRGERGARRPQLALALLVARVVADDHDAAVTTDHAALVAHLLNRRLDLHECSSFFAGLVLTRVRQPFLIRPKRTAGYL